MFLHSAFVATKTDTFLNPLRFTYKFIYHRNRAASPMLDSSTWCPEKHHGVRRAAQLRLSSWKNALVMYTVPVDAVWEAASETDGRSYPSDIFTRLVPAPTLGGTS